MSDSKYRNIYFFEKKEDSRLFSTIFWSQKVINVKKIFLHQLVLVRNRFINKRPFAEVESTIKPLPLGRLIKSAVAPLLLHSNSIQNTWIDR